MKRLAMILFVCYVPLAATWASDAPTIRHVNPETLAKPTGYTHVVEVSGGRTLYVSGQVALDKNGVVVGKDDIAAQSRQVFENLKAALAACGATPNDVVKITVYMTDLTGIASFRDVRNQYFTGKLPASTLVQVSRLARPDFMVEVEAVAVVER